jgi:archaellum component FlaC
MEEVNKTLQDLVNRVTTVSEEMGNFRKQMEDYGADLDGIKRKLVEGERA